MSEMRSYEAARLYFSILGFVSWCVIAGGGIMLLVGLSAGSQSGFGGSGNGMAIIGALPGLALMFFGFLGLVAVQIGRAGVDSAEYAQQSLKIAREQLEISRQALKQGDGQKAGYAALEAAKNELSASDATGRPAPSSVPIAAPKPSIERKVGDRIEHRGKTIEVVENGFRYAGGVFDTLDDAKDRIERHVASKALPPAGEVSS